MQCAIILPTICANLSLISELIFSNVSGDLLLPPPLKLMMVELIMIAGPVVKKVNTTKDTFMMLNHFNA